MGVMQWLELEEQVGWRWHRWISRGAESYPHHPEAAVTLDSLQTSLAVFFRTLGGGPAVQLAGTAARVSAHRLSWRQKLGLAEERLDRPSLDDATLFLPERIDLFADQALNRRLYFWLGAFFSAMAAEGAVAADTPQHRDLAFLRQVRRATVRVLAGCPGLAADHWRLCRAILEIRPRRSLPAQEAEIEAVVRGLLGAPVTGPAWDYVNDAGGRPLESFTATAYYRPFLPVPLWGEVAGGGAMTGEAAADDEDDAEAGRDETESKKRRGARRRQDQADRTDSLLLNRFEKILSLAEMVNVNRDVDDDDEENARKAADDMDEMVVSKVKKKPAVKLRFDLDLPPDAATGGALSGRFVYPEWDYRRRAYHPAHCQVVTGLAEEEGESWTPDAAAQRRIRQVRRQFEALRPRQTVLRGQADGDDLDLEAVVRARADLLASGQGSDRVFTCLRKTARDLSVAILMDVSLSTDAWVENRRVLDLEKEALSTLCSGLAACGDEHAVFTFTSRRRQFVRVSTVKDFDENFGPAVERRIGALKPGYYTRIGAALRHVAARLSERPHRHRLVLLLTDGKPNDLDHYEGRYGIEDTARAVREARRLGLAVFGVTIDRKAQDYFPMVFGRGGFAIVNEAGRLSAALPKIYRELVTR